MEFFKNYETLCIQKGLEPCSQKMAGLLGTTRANISAWRNKGTMPKGETFAAMADVLGTSTDFLLGRTDDPTDYSNPNLLAELSGPVLDAFGGDLQKAAAFQRAVATDALKDRPKIFDLYYKLDQADRIRAEAYIEGMLSGDKYNRIQGQEKQLAAV